MTETRIVSALQKVFSDGAELPPARDRLTLFAGERGSLQLVLKTDDETELTVSVETELPFRLFRVKNVPVKLAVYPNAVRCTTLRDAPGDYPDLLIPFDGTARCGPDAPVSIWAEFDAASKPAGAYEVRFLIGDGETTQTETARISVGSTALEPQKLIHTDWFHSDCLSTYYGAPVFSGEYWRIVEAFMKNAASHGVNCILTPLFTPPLDTEVGGERPTVQLVKVCYDGGEWSFDLTLLEKWIRLAEDCGIRYFEFSHLYTQWGAAAAPKIIADTPEGEKQVFGWDTDSVGPAYTAFLRAFGRALTAFTDRIGITDRCFVHCSDEPGKDGIERYAQCAAVVHEAFGAYRHIDALSDFDFYETGLVPLPVPSENSIAPFVGKVPELWTYYCCGQFGDEMPNRFIAFPSIRNRILGVLLYRYRCRGFLHWGYNFYYTQLSKRPVDPFTETDSGEAFPAGDAFCVYPGKNGEPLPSLRQKVFYDGLQDLQALETAETLLGRERVETLISETLGEITFSQYPMDEESFFRFRETLWQAAENADK